jgi:hypothetical protein
MMQWELRNQRLLKRWILKKGLSRVQTQAETRRMIRNNDDADAILLSARRPHHGNLDQATRSVI